jgi:Protein of unknown function (DUF3833)
MKLAAAAVVLAAAAAPAHAFDPVDFFRGRTQGDGVLKVVFQSPKKVSVDNEGIAEKDGSLLLKQTIHEQGKPPRTRSWRFRQTGPNRFDGTLTDASGPVRVAVDGETVRIRYKAKNQLDFDQLLTPLSPREVHNKMRVKRFGLVVAHFDETIRKLD